MKKKLVIFDMDGVLLDTERISDFCWEKAFREKGLIFSEKQRRLLIGKSIPETKKLFMESFKRDVFDELHDIWLELFTKHINELGVDVKEGVFDFISLLKEKDIKIAVASSTQSNKAVPLLKQVGLYELLDFRIFGDMVHVTKPNPQIYNMVVEHFGFNKQDAIIFEDSLAGVQAANNANIDVVWIEDLADLKDEKHLTYIMSTPCFKKSLTELSILIF